MLPAFPVAASVKFLTNSGVYLHIPFCKRKCKYCDFYSGCSDDSVIDCYTEALIKTIKQWGGKLSRPIDTIYLGGGTPSVLAHRLPKVINAVKSSFNVVENSEITLEINPSGDCLELLEYAKKAGINRLSIGIQSGDDKELEVLGRTHNFEDAKSTFLLARKLGFDNISVDLMIGLPDSMNNSKLKESLDKITALNPEHISAYILKIEPNTVFYKLEKELKLPDDDEISNQYLFMCRYLEEKGYCHYEISNFSKKGYESRHNLKYWLLEDYLGIGPSAHSFINGERFFYPRDIKAFIAGNKPISDGFGGGAFEYIMLKLRLAEGIIPDEYKRLTSKDLPENFYNKCRIFEKAGYMKIKDNRYSLTNEGMLLSNSIIGELSEEIGEEYENT